MKHSFFKTIHIICSELFFSIPWNGRLSNTYSKHTVAVIRWLVQLTMERVVSDWELGEVLVFTLLAQEFGSVTSRGSWSRSIDNFVNFFMFSAVILTSCVFN